MSLLLLIGWLLTPVAVPAAELTGTIVDAETGAPIAARIYVRAPDRRWLFVESASAEGTALAYREQWVPMADSVEKHTTVSAHPFRIDLARGDYTVTVERGKEYLPLTETVRISDRPLSRTFRLKRWIDLAARGWFSGETHVHRRIEELPNVLLAEDLNVAFPVTFWTVQAFEAPGLKPSPLRRQGPSPFGPRSDRGHAMISVDATHVIFPRNTEYEIFSVGEARHVLGAIFILNHRTAFKQGMPPVARIAEQAHREGALLDLDKHSWPWSMMLVPIAKVDLYELANNSVWRTKFGFRRSAVKPPDYMNVESDERGMTEWGWLNFGFENYYTLLNCGFRLQPTAGTASGVHPVPLGYSRVYVHVGERFDPQVWLDGLRRGRSFVTTGPMLFATLDGERPGRVFRRSGETKSYRLSIESISARSIDRLEVIENGRVVRTIQPDVGVAETQTPRGGHAVRAEVTMPVANSSWIAVRSFERQPDGRIRFAHTAPWHIEVDDRPIEPRRQEVEFLIDRLRDEISRNEKILPEAAIAEFHRALKVYEGILERARND